MKTKTGALVLLIALTLFHSGSAQDTLMIKSEVYSQLKCCACQQSFAQCLCPEASSIKGYVDGLVDSGIGQEDIFYKVAQRFSLDVIADKQIKAQIEKRITKENGGKIPRIAAEELFFNLGQVSKVEGQVGKTLTLYNKGKEKLTIANLRTSCACVSVSLKSGEDKSAYFSVQGAPAGWQAVIDPNKSAELEVIIDLNHSSVKTGKLIREVYVTSNDPLYPELSITFEAEVVD